jgi:membrane protease YdiL (CAAX protease family)
MNASRHKLPSEKAQKSFGAKLLHSAFTRIIVGSASIFLVGILMKWIFEPLLLSIGLEVNIAKTIRYSLTIAAMLSTYYWLFTYYERRKITELAKGYFLKDSLLGNILAILSISAVMLILYLGGYYQVVVINDNALNLLFPLVFIALMGTLEELIFRGVLYRIIETRLSTNLALIISGLFFGLSHITNEHATILSVLGAGIGGLIAGMMFSTTKRLWLPISFHIMWNFMQVFYGTPVSGIDEFSRYSFFQSRLQGPDLLTGGPFGPENSIITIILTLIIFGAFYFVAWKNDRLIAPFWRIKEQVQ